MPILGIGTWRYRPICEGKGPRAHVQTLDEGWNVPRGTAPIWKGRGRPREEAGGRGNSMSCGDTVGRFESNPEHLNGFTGPGEAIFAKDETNAHEWSSSSAPRRFKPGSPRPVISLPYTSLAPVKPHFSYSGTRRAAVGTVRICVYRLCAGLPDRQVDIDGCHGGSTGTQRLCSLFSCCAE